MMFSRDRNKTFQIHPDTNEIQVGGQKIKLSPKEMGVLELLNDRHGTTVSRTELLESVWGDQFANDQGLTQAVSRLREVLSKSRHVTIRTIPKKGYQLHKAEVQSRPILVRRLSMKTGVILTILLSLIIYILIFVKRIEIRVDKLEPEMEESSISTTD